MTETSEAGLRARLVRHRFEFAAVCPSFQYDRPLMKGCQGVQAGSSPDAATGAGHPVRGLLRALERGVAASDPDP